MRTFPVYLPYVIQLERYFEVEAKSIEEAQAIVYRLVREGKIQAPSYTEGLADWTEVTDLPNAKSRFLIEES